MAGKAKSQPEPSALPPGCEALLSREQVCAALSISERTFRSIRSSGEFPPADFNVASLPRWRVSTLNAWIASQGARKE